ncbi:MAG: HAD family hydrolase [Minisyncoccia bacterium]|jgi:pyrophosphatase PpaX
MIIEAILFDLDGVIVDSNRPTIEYFQETFRHFKLPIPQEKDFLPLLGLKTLDITKKLLPSLSEEEVLPIYEYSKKMSVAFAPKITLMAHASEVLEAIKKNYKTALITSRGRTTTTMLLKKFDLRKYFDVVLDREDVKNHKPNPEGIIKAMDHLGIKDRTKALYVGDYKEDIEAAHNADIKCVLVAEKGDNLGEDFKIVTLSELPSLVEGIAADC